MSTTNGTGRKVGKARTIDVSRLLQEGQVATLSVGRWRAEIRLTPEDLGIKESDKSLIQEYMSLGKKTLIPPKVQKKLNSIENNARFYLKRNSLETPFGRFVPARAYPELDAQMNRLEKEWFEQRDLLVKNMGPHLEEARNAYYAVARQIFARCGMAKATKYAERILAEIPTLDMIHDSFHFTLEVFDAPLLKVLDKNVRDRIVKEEREAGKLKTVVEKENAVREMNRLIAERYARDKQQKIDSFLNGINAQVRTMVHTTVTAAMGSLENNKKIISKTAGQLKNLVKRFEVLNILDDKELADEIAVLSKKLDAKHEDLDTKSINDSLVQLAATANNLALDLEIVQHRAPRGHIIPVGSFESKRLAPMSLSSRGRISHLSLED